MVEISRDLRQEKNLGEPLCAHCGTAVPWSRLKPSEVQQFCCAGCETLYVLLHSCNLTEYYKIRDSQNIPGRPVEFQEEETSYLSDPNVQKEYLLPDGSMSFYVGGIQCAACVWVLERIPELDSSVSTARVDGVRHIATVRARDAVGFHRFSNWAQRLGYRVTPIRPDEDLTPHQKKNQRSELKRLAVAAVGAGNIMMLAISVYLRAEEGFSKIFNLFSFAMCAVVLFYSGGPIFVGSWRALRSRAASLDLPLAVALLAGFALSTYHLLAGRDRVYFDSLSVLVFLILSGRYLVQRMQERFIGALHGAVSLLPAFATLSTGQRVSLRAVKVGDTLSVRKGELIPVDGVVERGEGWVNSSVLTGESFPRFQIKGNEVFAGTRLEAGEITFVARSDWSASRLNRIQTQATRTSLERGRYTQSMERWAQNFTWLVMGAASVGFLWLLPQGLSVALDRSLSLLIVACPCALAFGAPLVYAQALAVAARRGLFLKSAESMEKSLEIRNVVFDKTGTLTQGDLTLMKESDALSDEDRLSVVAIEAFVDHPVARAIVKSLGQGVIPAATEIQVEPGRGVSGQVAGHLYQICTSTRSHQAHGVWISVFRDSDWIGDLGFSDTLKPEGEAVVETFRQAGATPWILSGDRSENVEVVARQLRIPEGQAKGGLSPEEKEKFLSRLEKPMMIGDGVNDSAAMARSFLGIAVGGGMEQALRVADVFVMKSGFAEIPFLRVAAGRARRTMKSIRIFSIGYNLTTGTLALAGVISPLLAAILMPVSSVSVVALSSLGMRSLWKS